MPATLKIARTICLTQEKGALMVAAFFGAGGAERHYSIVRYSRVWTPAPLHFPLAVLSPPPKEEGLPHLRHGQGILFSNQMAKWAYTKYRLVEIYGPNCHWCGQETKTDVGSEAPNRRTLDHLVRRADGGKTSLENCRIACARCNSQRHADDDEAYHRARKIAKDAAQREKQPQAAKPTMWPPSEVTVSAWDAWL